METGNNNNGSKSSILLDSQRSQRKSVNSEKMKSFLFEKKSKKSSMSLIPIEQFSFPSIPEIEDESSDLTYVALLNWGFLESQFVKLSYMKFDEEKKKGLLNYSILCDNFNKINFTNRNVKKAMMVNEGSLYMDDNCEISYKITNFVNNTNFLRLELLILKKKGEIQIHEMKMKMDTNSTSNLYNFLFLNNISL